MRQCDIFSISLLSKGLNTILYHFIGMQILPHTSQPQ